MVTGERRTLSMWWDHSTWQHARAAFVAELDDDPPGPPSLLAWIAAAIHTHAARSPAARATRSGDLREDGGPGFQRVHQLPPATMDAVDRAVAEDRRAGRMLSRSAWVREAAAVAAAGTSRRHAGALPGSPDRLPPGRVRRTG
jgi:hypothetical protein